MLTLDEVLTRGVEQILPSKGALTKLMKSKKITLYQGFDPTANSLQIGNFSGLLKLRQFQQLGHKVIFLIGDFTAMIGDPDKQEVRKMLTREQVSENLKNWRSQVEKIIDFKGKNKAEILLNSSWLDKLSFKEIIEITSHFTIQQISERDMFQKRFKENKPLYVHEYLYPIAQAYDAVHMDVDLEIGGNDQFFNMMAGRDLMKAVKGREKYVLTIKLLIDKDGNKVGKTTGNALFLSSTPSEFFGGIMAFPDEVLELSFELLTELPLEGLKTKIKANPMIEKKRLAFEVVKIIYGESEAGKAQEYFENNFQKQGQETFEKQKLGKNVTLLDFISDIVESKSEAKRLIFQNAVEVNGKLQTDLRFEIKVGDKIKLGKRKFIEIC